MLLFTGIFGGLMLLSIDSRRRVLAVMLIGCIAILAGCGKNDVFGGDRSFVRSECFIQ